MVLTFADSAHHKPSIRLYRVENSLWPFSGKRHPDLCRHLLRLRVPKSESGAGPPTARLPTWRGSWRPRLDSARLQAQWLDGANRLPARTNVCPSRKPRVLMRPGISGTVCRRCRCRKYPGRIAGISRDPYQGAPHVGRLRPVYATGPYRSRRHRNRTRPRPPRPLQQYFSRCPVEHGPTSAGPCSHREDGSPSQ
jgi:hypothetical protein